jgi:hypothetical protein
MVRGFDGLNTARGKLARRRKIDSPVIFVRAPSLKASYSPFARRSQTTLGPELSSNATSLTEYNLPATTALAGSSDCLEGISVSVRIAPNAHRDEDQWQKNLPQKKN